MFNTLNKKHVYIAAAVVSMLLAVALLFYMLYQSTTLPNLKMSDEFSTYDKLIKHSPVVVTATVTSGNKKLVYKEMTFALTEVQVNDSIRGDVGEETLQILQTRSNADPYLKKGKQVLLFLSEYEGPIAQNVYVINGLYHGQYMIKNNTLHAVKGKNEAVTFLKSTDLDSVIFDVKNTEYVAIPRKTLTPEEIEELNRMERELEKELEAREK